MRELSSSRVLTTHGRGVRSSMGKSRGADYPATPITSRRPHPRAAVLSILDADGDGPPRGGGASPSWSGAGAGHRAVHGHRGSGVGGRPRANSVDTPGARRGRSTRVFSSRPLFSPTLPLMPPRARPPQASMSSSRSRGVGIGLTCPCMRVEPLAWTYTQPATHTERELFVVCLTSPRRYGQQIHARHR